MADPDFGFRPDDAIQSRKENKKVNKEAFDQLVVQIQDDPDATTTEKKLAAALSAIMEAQGNG